MERTVLHCDCNCFYASVECLLHPELRPHPVAVGGDEASRHGIILTKNYLAASYGVKTGEAIWQARQKCPNLVVVPAHYSRYVQFSQLAREIYQEYTNRVEPFGLDEAWLDVTGEDGRAVAEEIRQRIRRELGITISVGVSFNKVFAKFGSDYKKPDAVTCITKENFQQVVWPCPVRDLLYVGKATEQKLHAMSVHTIGELAQLPVWMLKRRFGKVGEMLYAFANGWDASPVALSHEHLPPKSIGNSTTPPRDMTTVQEASQVLYLLCDSVGMRMREQNLQCRCVHVSLRRAADLCTFTHQQVLPSPTDLTRTIHQTALALLRSHPFTSLRSVGISVSDFSVGGEQLTFFENQQQKEKWKKLDAVTDSLHRRFGNRCIGPASVYTADIRELDPKRDHIAHPIGFLKGDHKICNTLT